MSKPARPASRILLIDPDERILLFRFTAEDRPPFWCTPGGALDKDEDYRTGARRELREETGIDCDCGDPVAEKRIEFTTLEGLAVEANERYFLVRTDRTEIDIGGHTELERKVMRDWRWFRLDEIEDWGEKVYPEDLIEMLEELEPGE